MCTCWPGHFVYIGGPGRPVAAAAGAGQPVRYGEQPVPARAGGPVRPAVSDPADPADCRLRRGGAGARLPPWNKGKGEKPVYLRVRYIHHSEMLFFFLLKRLKMTSVVLYRTVV